MELKDLVGLKWLSGVDRSNERIKNYCNEFEDCDVINFTLDGVTYSALEDPNDGYRSSMRSLGVSNMSTNNKFKRVKVFCKMKEEDYNKNDVLQVIDVKTNKIILEVGTESYDDYYPCFVANFNPENMACNQGK